MRLFYSNVLSEMFANTARLPQNAFFFRLCWVKYANTQTRFPLNAFIFFDCVEWNMLTHKHCFPLMRLFSSIVLSEICNTQTLFPLNAFIFFDCVEWNMRTHKHGFPLMRLFSSIVLSEICEHTDMVSPQCVHFIGSWQRTVGRTKWGLQYEAGWTEYVWVDSSTS